MVKASENYAEKLTPGILQAAQQKSCSLLQGEIDRLQALKSVNPNVRQEEIDFYQRQLSLVNDKIETSSLRLDGMRVIIVT